MGRVPTTRRVLLQMAITGVALLIPKRLLAILAGLDGPSGAMAQTIPPPHSLPSLSDPSIGLSVHGARTGSEFDPSRARTMAGRAVAGVRELADVVEGNTRALNDLKERLAVCLQKIDQLLREKAVALAELEQGLYCSKCNRPKSRIEREDREDFYVHIRRVNGQIIRAPQAVINDTRNAYDHALQQLEQEKAQLQKTVADKERENLAAWDQIQQGLNFWRFCTTAEESMIQTAEERRRTDEANDIAQAMSKLDQIEAERARWRKEGGVKGVGDQGTIEALDAAQALWQGIIQKTRAAQQQRISYEQQELDLARNTRQNEYAQLMGAIQRTSAYSSYTAGVFKNLPTLTVALGPLALTSAKEQLGFRFAFGTLTADMKLSAQQAGIYVGLGTGLSVGMEAASTTPASAEIRGFFEYVEKYTKARVRTGVSSGTTWTPTGPVDENVTPHLQHDLPKPLHLPTP